jgi:hypothetical protein
MGHTDNKGLSSKYPAIWYCKDNPNFGTNSNHLISIPPVFGLAYNVDFSFSIHTLNNLTNPYATYDFY